MKRLATSLFLTLNLTLTLVAGCANGATPPAGEAKVKLPIFHAGSLTIPFEQISKEFNQLYPDVEILLVAAGSQTAIRKVTELGRECGVIGSADYAIIPKLMFPDYADWYITFAANQIVIGYTDKSRFKDEINANNWYEILQRDGVKYGRADPDQDPCGYRTLMAWQLAEDYYNQPGLYKSLDTDDIQQNVMRRKSVELIALLESGDLDYAFEYLSVAVQHKLNYVVLPAEINLSQEKFKDFYATAKVEIPGKEPGQKITQTGTPIAYAVTIPKSFPNQELAIAWVDFLLSDEGKAIMEANGQPPITPADTNDKSKLPDELRKYVTGVD